MFPLPGTPCQSFGGSLSGGNGASTSYEKDVDHAGGSMLMRQSSPATSIGCSGDDGFDYGCGSGGGDDAENARGELAKEFGPPEASSWCTTARAPKAGERVQVFGGVVWCGVARCGVVRCGTHKCTVEIESRRKQRSTF